MAHFEMENHGSIWLCRPLTEEAYEHLLGNVADEAQWYTEALAVEPRYVEGLIQGLTENGWEVE